MDQHMFSDFSAFCKQAFGGCKIYLESIPAQSAFRLLVQVQSAGIWQLKPPQGFCIVGVKHRQGITSFEMIVFEQDFLKYHLLPTLN